MTPHTVTAAAQLHTTPLLILICLSILLSSQCMSFTWQVHSAAGHLQGERNLGTADGNRSIRLQFSYWDAVYRNTALKLIIIHISEEQWMRRLHNRKIGRSYWQTHESHHPTQPLLSVVQLRGVVQLFVLILQTATLPFWFTLTCSSLTIKLWRHSTGSAPNKYFTLRKYRFILSVIFWANLSNTCWFQLLKCKNVLFFFVTYDSEGRLFGFWNVLTTDWLTDSKNMC